MTSKLVVNTIEADTGISSVSFASSISMSSTSKFHFSTAGIDIGADTNINRPASGVLGFNINSSEKVRIDSNNKVGIATDTGNGLINTRHAGTNQQVLHVRADLGSSNGRSLNLYTPDTDNTEAPFRFQTGNGYLFQCDSENVFTIAHDRKIGIGTNNPTAKLEVKGSNNPLVKIVQDTSGIARLNIESATNDGYQYSGIGLGDGTNDAELMWTTGGFDINVGNAVRFRINSNGAWGAGTNFGTSGQVLTSQGSGSAVQWATPSSGLSHAQQWYLTANGDTGSGNTDHVLPTSAGTWQKQSASTAGVSAGTLGSDMTYDGSGVFAFPVTGIWKIEFQGWWGISASDSDHYLRSRIQTTVNNSSWTTVQEQANSVKSDAQYTYQGFNVSYLFDVTSTTNCKVRFVLNPSGSNTYYKADGSPAKTGALFIRLGDT